MPRGRPKKIEQTIVSTDMWRKAMAVIAGEVSDGSTAHYYELPKGSTELQDLISHKNMNAQVGEMFRALYRYGEPSHSDEEREMRKVIFYAQAELKRLKKS